MIQTNMKNYLCLPHISGFWTILFWEYVHVSKCFFSLKEGLTLHFNILEFPLQNYSWYHVLWKFSIREKVDFVKIKIKRHTVYRQKNRRTEAGQKVIQKFTYAFSTGGQK